MRKPTILMFSLEWFEGQSRWTHRYILWGKNMVSCRFSLQSSEIWEVMMDSSWTKGGDTVSLVLLGFDSTSRWSHTIILAMLPMSPMLPMLPMLELSKHVESRPGHRDKPLAGAFGQASSVHLSLNELSLRIEQLQQATAAGCVEWLRFPSRDTLDYHDGISISDWNKKWWKIS